MRPAQALIDLSALRHNYQLAKSLSERRALAVVKANAYGHGAVQCAEALQTDADGFAVACIEEAPESRSAGIRVVMITGDNPLTAGSIANQIGLGSPKPILGADLEEMNDAALIKALAEDVLFARTEPKHKIRIVTGGQQTGR